MKNISNMKEKIEPKLNQHSIIFNNNKNKQKLFNDKLFSNILENNSPFIIIDNDDSGENFYNFFKIMKEKNIKQNISVLSFRKDISSTNDFNDLNSIKELLFNDLIRNYQNILKISEIFKNDFLYILLPKNINKDLKVQNIITTNLISRLKQHIAYFLTWNNNKEEINNFNNKQKYVVFNNFCYDLLNYNSVSTLLRQRRRLKYSFIFDIDENSTLSEIYNDDVILCNFFNKVFLNNNHKYLINNINNIIVNEKEGILVSKEYSGKFEI